MGDEEQLKILSMGIAVWNKWREKNPRTNVDLSGMICSESWLIEADLSGANLTRTNFGGAILSQANLRGARLEDASFEGVEDFRIDWFHGDVAWELGVGAYETMDLVLGCLDNVEARLAVNRGCWMAGKPWIDVEGPPIASVPQGLQDYHFNDELLGQIRAAELEMLARKKEKPEC